MTEEKYINLLIYNYLSGYVSSDMIFDLFGLIDLLLLMAQAINNLMN